jgi:hypothetical protein
MHVSKLLVLLETLPTTENGGEFCRLPFLAQVIFNQFPRALISQSMHVETHCVHEEPLITLQSQFPESQFNQVGWREIARPGLGELLALVS